VALKVNERGYVHKLNETVRILFRTAVYFYLLCTLQESNINFRCYMVRYWVYTLPSFNFVQVNCSPLKSSETSSRINELKYWKNSCARKCVTRLRKLSYLLRCIKKHRVWCNHKFPLDREIFQFFSVCQFRVNLFVAKILPPSVTRHTKC